MDTTEAYQIFDTTLFTISFSSFYNNAEFSDVTVKCGDHEFRVHKLVLSAHSSVFRKMFMGGWKESTEGILEIDDQPHIVEAMLFYMYNFRYNTEEGLVEQREAPLIFEARMYAIAELYNIDALKQYAKTNFAQGVAVKDTMPDWTYERFSDAISVVYSSTIETDRGLRDIVVTVACEEIGELSTECPHFTKVLEDPESMFAANLVQALALRLKDEYSGYPLAKRGLISRDHFELPTSARSPGAQRKYSRRERLEQRQRLIAQLHQEFGNAEE